MITNEAIAMAQAIVEAVKQAKITHVDQGVFVSKSNEKGKYEFILPSELIIGDKTLLEWLKLLEGVNDTQTSEISELKALHEQEGLLERVIKIESILQELGKYLKEEGEVL